MGHEQTFTFVQDRASLQFAWKKVITMWQQCLKKVCFSCRRAMRHSHLMSWKTVWFGSVSSEPQKRESRHCLASDLGRASQTAGLRDGSRVKATQRFHRKGEEDEALTLASISSSVENLLKIVFRVSAERVQQVPIYWRIIPFDTKNSFRASAERVQSAPIYWRIIPFIKEAPTDQDCKWSPGK